MSGTGSDKLDSPRIKAIAAAIRAGDQARVNQLVQDSIAEHLAGYVADRMVAQTSPSAVSEMRFDDWHRGGRRYARRRR